MNTVSLLREEAALGFSQLQASLDGLNEGIAWAKADPRDGEYLNTNGTIVGIVLHVAVCKLIYASAAFRDLELRFRDCMERQEAVGTSLAASKTFLEDCHRYWMDSWSDLKDDEIENERMTFRGDTKPTWKLIATVTQHDAYHGAQIELLRVILPPAAEPPDMLYDLERSYVVDLPTY